MGNKSFYNLILEYRHGDFMPIDINLLLGNKVPVDYHSLETIDFFTKKYTEDELLGKIKEANIVDNKYLLGEFKIINERKYLYSVITKSDNLELDVFIKDNINNKAKMNKIANIYKKYDEENFPYLQDGINDKNDKLIIGVLMALPYEKLRSIYTYVLENMM